MASMDGFDANTVEPGGVFDPIPPAKYLAAIVESERKPTKTGDGEQLSLKFQVLDGEFKGRTLFANLNIKNKSEVAVKIARGELSAICRAVGVLTPKDSQELHNLPLLIKVGQEARKDTGEIVNKIKAYEARPTLGAPTAPATTGAVATTPPWARKA